MKTIYYYAITKEPSTCQCCGAEHEGDALCIAIDKHKFNFLLTPNHILPTYTALIEWLTDGNYRIQDGYGKALSLQGFKELALDIAQCRSGGQLMYSWESDRYDTYKNYATYSVRTEPPTVQGVQGV